MSDFALSYAAQIHRFTSIYYANWFPENPIVLGDFGILREGILFERKGNISRESFGISFSKNPHSLASPVNATETNHYRYITNNGSSFETLIKGKNILAKGGLAVNLVNDNSFFVDLYDTAVQEIDDQILLSEQIVDLYKKKLWQKEWVIITSVVFSSSSTILGSRKGNHSTLLEATTDISLANHQQADLKFEKKGSSSLDYEMISSSGVVPMFKVSKLKKKLLKGIQLGLSDDEDVDLDELRDQILEEDEDLKSYITLSPADDDF